MPDIDDIPPAALLPMSPTEGAAFRSAAYRATRLYPGPIGELVSRELLAADEFGWALGCDSLMLRVRNTVMQQYREQLSDRPAPKA